MVKFKCKVCGTTKKKVRANQKFCGTWCAEKSRGIFKKCLFCKKQFKGREKVKFCSRTCSANYRIPELVERNKARRKYHAVPGLNRCQVFRLNNPEQYKKDLRREVIKREELVRNLGNKCAQCGFNKDIRALQIDHIKGDGHQDRKNNNGTKIYGRWLKNLEEAKESLQVLCANCNKIKQTENKEF